MRDILGTERQLLKGSKKLYAAAGSESLRTAFEMNYTQTEGQIERLKQVFSCIGLSARARNIRQWEACWRKQIRFQKASQDEPEVLDALISAAKKVEHL